MVKNINDRLGSIAIPQKSQHKRAIREDQGKQNFAASGADNRIHLCIMHIRILLHKMIEVIQRTADSTGSIYFVLNWFASARLHSDNSGHIDIVCFQESAIHISIKCFLRNVELIWK